MAANHVRGGAKLSRFLRNARASGAASQPTIEAGFLERHVASLAARLEFGDPKTSLPERPAFRTATADALAAGSAIVAKSLGSRVRSGNFAVDDADAKRAAEAMVETIRDSYRAAHFAPLSERQTARKAGTPFAARELVGRSGEKLIARIRGRVR